LYTGIGKPFKGDLKSIDAKLIKSVNVIKTKEQLAKYGSEASNGVVEITLVDGASLPE
jgi:hypothetical protein